MLILFLIIIALFQFFITKYSSVVKINKKKSKTSPNEISSSLHPQLDHLQANSVIHRSFSRLIKKNYNKLIHNYFTNENLLYLFIQSSLIIILIITQITLIHQNLISSRLNSTSLQATACSLLEKYLFEELIYFSLAFILLFVIIIFQRKRRFSNYIMQKHKVYLQSRKPCFILTEIFSFKFLKNFPSPSLPFSISNRASTASVYIVYTYDVLNILMSVYTDNLSSSFLSSISSNVTNLTGVIFDFLFQILQVVLIGVKFYPILVAADSDPNVFIYFFSFIYVLIIWFIGLVNKAACAPKEAFFKRTLLKLSSNFSQKSAQVSNQSII